MRQLQDAHGVYVRRGDIVRILAIDPTLIASVPEPERSRIESMLDSEAAIQEIVEGGFVLVERIWNIENGNLLSHSIALNEKEFELVRPLPLGVTDFDLDVLGCLLDDYESIQSLQSGYFPPGPESISPELIKGALATVGQYGLASAYLYSAKLNQFQHVSEFELSQSEIYYWRATSEGRTLFGLAEAQ